MEQIYLTDNQIEEEIKKGRLPGGMFDGIILARLNQAGVWLQLSSQGIRWSRNKQGED